MFLTKKKGLLIQQQQQQQQQQQGANNNSNFAQQQPQQSSPIPIDNSSTHHQQSPLHYESYTNQIGVEKMMNYRSNAASPAINLSMSQGNLSKVCKFLYFRFVSYWKWNCFRGNFGYWLVKLIMNPWGTMNGISGGPVNIGGLCSKMMR